MPGEMLFVKADTYFNIREKRRSTLSLYILDIYDKIILDCRKIVIKINHNFFKGAVVGGGWLVEVLRTSLVEIEWHFSQLSIHRLL